MDEKWIKNGKQEWLIMKFQYTKGCIEIPKVRIKKKNNKFSCEIIK